MSRDHHDILMDQLLREVLGGDRPRDLTERVMTRARAYDRTHRAWWAGAVSALAASIVVAITLWMFWPREYPAPHIEDGTAFTENGAVERGTRIVTDEEQTATLSLGNYVKLAMEPLTSLTIGGTKYAEKVFLEEGELDVDVTKNRGKFDLAVGPVVVQVTGTQFRARVRDEILESEERIAKRLFISVKEGSVIVGGAGKSTRLAAGSGVSEGIFEISSEPRKVERTAPVDAQPLRPPEPRPTTPDTRPQTRIAETRQPGRAIETRPQPRIPVPPATRAVTVTTKPGIGEQPYYPLPQRLGAVVPGQDKPLMVLLSGRGRTERDGVLRRPNNTIYLLETPHALILLFPQSPPLPDMPERGTAVHVVFEGGRAVRVEPKRPGIRGELRQQ